MSVKLSLSCHSCFYYTSSSILSCWETSVGSIYTSSCRPHCFLVRLISSRRGADGGPRPWSRPGVRVHCCSVQSQNDDVIGMFKVRDEADHLPFKEQTSRWTVIKFRVYNFFFHKCYTCFFKSSWWNKHVAFYPLTLKSPSQQHLGIRDIQNVSEPWQPDMRLPIWRGLGQESRYTASTQADK